MSDTTPNRKRRLRFSLLNLLFLLTAVASVFGLMRARERNLELMGENHRVVAGAEVVEAENTTLRAELGVITVTDPTKFHAMQIQSDNDLEWKWRIYMPELPAKRRYQLHKTDQATWRKGPSSSGSSQGALIAAGQQTISYRIFEDEQKGGWYSELSTKTSKLKHNAPPIDEWPRRASRLTTEFGLSEVKAIKVGEPIELFRLRLEGYQIASDAKPWPREPVVEVEVTLKPLD